MGTNVKMINEVWQRFTNKSLIILATQNW